MFEADFGRSHGWRRTKAHLRRTVRPRERDEGKAGRRRATLGSRFSAKAGGLVGEKTFGVICQREWVFPKSLAPARRAGETLSRAEHSRSMRRSRTASRAQPLAREFGESLSSWNRRFLAVQCAALIAPYGAPLHGEAAPPHQGRERLITLR